MKKLITLALLLVLSTLVVNADSFTDRWISSSRYYPFSFDGSQYLNTRAEVIEGRTFYTTGLVKEYWHNTYAEYCTLDLKSCVKLQIE